ncbi:MAG: MFS transporter [Gemmobacter sp.]
MIPGIAALIAAYVLSQFYRAFLAVMAPALTAELGATPEHLASASGVWFLTFALMQIPVGVALDRFGPRRTASIIFAAGGAGGALAMALATSPLGITLALGLIGVGCAPVLMASYYVFARIYPAAVFGTLAGAMIGIGSMGNIAASLPLAWAMQAIGWRGTMLALAGVSLAIALAVALLLRDPPRVPGGQRGSLLDLLRIPAIWLILPMMAVNYVPAAALRGLWAGPYMADVFGADAAGIGQATLVMGLAMVVGNFAYGPLDRVLGTRKWLIVGGNLCMVAALLALWALPPGQAQSVALLSAVGLFGASFPMMMAHGRAFLPPHLVGRGVTLFNFFALGTVGAAQIVTGRLHAAVTGPPEAPYAALFLFFALATLAGLAVYLFAPDRTD